MVWKENVVNWHLRLGPSLHAYNFYAGMRMITKSLHAWPKHKRRVYARNSCTLELVWDVFAYTHSGVKQFLNKLYHATMRKMNLHVRSERP